MILSYLSFTRTEGVLHLKIGRCVSRPSNWRYVFQFRPTYAWDLLTWGFLDGTTSRRLWSPGWRWGFVALAAARALPAPWRLTTHASTFRPFCVIRFLNHHIFRPILLSSRTCIRTTSTEFRISEREWKCLTHDRQHREEMVLVWKSRLYQGPLSSATFGADVEMQRQYPSRQKRVRWKYF
jgi:hypothetical protein